jgi:hypothetical protein
MDLLCVIPIAAPSSLQEKVQVAHHHPGTIFSLLTYLPNVIPEHLPC